jgi:hypothetical protein
MQCTLSALNVSLSSLVPFKYLINLTNFAQSASLGPLILVHSTAIVGCMSGVVGKYGRQNENPVCPSSGTIFEELQRNTNIQVCVYHNLCLSFALACAHRIRCRRSASDERNAHKSSGRQNENNLHEMATIL